MEMRYRALANPKNSLQENLETETIHLNQIHPNSNETRGTNSGNKKLVQTSRPRNGYSLQLLGQISDVQCENARN